MLIIVLLNRLFLRIEQRRNVLSYYYLPIFVALLFLVHPLQTQAVTYIVQRLTSIATMFVLLSLIFYLKFRDTTVKYFYLMSLICALFAYKTKENTATLFLSIIVLEVLFFRVEKCLTLKKRIALLSPFIILIIVIPLAFMDLNSINLRNFLNSIIKTESSIQNVFKELLETTQETKLISRKQYLLTEFSVIVTYIKMLFLPINQSLHHMYPLANAFFEMRTLTSFILLLSIIIGAIFLSRKYIEILFGVLWFFIFLLIESSIIPIQDVIYEHRVYLPSIGFFIVFVYGLYFIFGAKRYKLFVSLIFIFAILFSILTYERNMVWRDEVSIWQDVVNKYPLNYIAHGSLGTAYAKIDRCDKAIEELKISIDLYPYYAKSYNNLATCYLKMGKIKVAIDMYKKAIEIDPNYVRAYYNLASLYYLHGDKSLALFYLLFANEIDDRDAMVNGQLGSIYCQIGNYNKGIYYFQKALLIEPDNDTIQYNYKRCLCLMGGACSDLEINKIR